MYQTFKMASSNQELKLSVGWDIIDACSGFSFDCGGSVLKLIYVAKDDFVEPEKRKQNSKCCLLMKTFDNDDIDIVFEFIKKHVYVQNKSPKDMADVYTTGVGGTQFSKKLKESLNMQNSILLEMDCFTHGFMYLVRNYPRNEVLHPISKPAVEAAQKEMEQMMVLMTQFKQFTSGMDSFSDLPPMPSKLPKTLEDNPDCPLIEDKDLFPCAMVMCGSATGLFLVNGDGSFQMGDNSNRGGRMFLGLSSLLTEYKDFDELMNMCEKGVAKNISVTSNSIGKEMGDKDQKEDAYSVLLDSPLDFTAFCFGKAVGKKTSDFRKEDLARCVLETLVYDLVNFSFYICKYMKVRHAFFCGGFVTQPLVRRLITEEWLKKDIPLTMFDPEQRPSVQHHFLVQAQQLGALGALLNHKLKWSAKVGGPPPMPSKETEKPAKAKLSEDNNNSYKSSVGF